ncbi:MAG: SAM-dependent chlorinase/fluorinase [bacterium]|nr:SAM-dependent chlorinase/fluorinase [bacterium]
MAAPFITLTTDFGLRDGYVASMKGVILSIAPDTRIVDITHEIEPQDVKQAGIVLATAAGYFPSGTVHVVVVDPGVGTDRALLAVEAGTQIFLAPDNGLLGVIFEKYPLPKVHQITNKKLFMPRVSRTFHGRDILSPVAAYLTKGLPIKEVGPIITKYDRGDFLHPVTRVNSVRGMIVYRDHFGNLMTNISDADLQSWDPANLEIRAGYTKIVGLSGSYSDVEKGELLCCVGSAGYLEIALREGSASDKLRFPLGTEVEVTGTPARAPQAKST